MIVLFGRELIGLVMSRQGALKLAEFVLAGAAIEERPELNIGQAEFCGDSGGLVGEVAAPLIVGCGLIDDCLLYTSRCV